MIEAFWQKGESMYLSEMDLLKARLTAEGRLSQSRILQEILREDSQSEQKRKMREGERYYRCDHDILRKDFRRTTISETKNGAEELKPSQPQQSPQCESFSPYAGSPESGVLGGERAYHHGER